MSNEVIRGRESNLAFLSHEIGELKKRERCIKSSGFSHRVPLELFSLSPEEFDKEIYDIWDKQIITLDEYVSYICKKNDNLSLYDLFKAIL